MIRNPHGALPPKQIVFSKVEEGDVKDDDGEDNNDDGDKESFDLWLDD